MTALEETGPESAAGDLLASALVRITTAGGAVCGAGFLITGDRVATCAHVVADALGIPRSTPKAPTATVGLEFPLLGGPEPSHCRAEVVEWVPIASNERGDIAILRLTERAPAGAVTVPARVTEAVWKHPVSVLGFPEHHDDGLWVTGELLGKQGTGWRQLRTDPMQPYIRPGFSGAPVFDEQLGGVVGMVVTADGDSQTTAFLIPTTALGRFWQAELRNPYRGLEPFSEQDADVFHGRDDDIERLVSELDRTSMLAVAGPSGSGKSSLVRAGLLPRLRREGALIAVASPRPEAEPLAILIDAVAPLLNRATDQNTVDRSDISTVEELRAALLTASQGQRVLIFLDQFEELVVADSARARDLLTLVTALTSWNDDGESADPNSVVPADSIDLAGEELATGVHLVLTLRSRSLDSLLTSGTAQRLNQAVHFVGDMNRNQLREAIVRPAHAIGGRAFEQGLVERILDDTAQEPGALPLVALVLKELWERSGVWLTWADYDRLGRVQGALATSANRAISDLIRAEIRQGRNPQGITGHVRRLLHQLTRLDREGGYARRTVLTSDIPGDTARLLPSLAASRLVVLSETRDGRERVELVHQALIDHWPRLRKWLAEDRDFLAWQADLRQDYDQWIQADRDNDGLLRGVTLDTALRWMRTHDGELSPDQRAFIRRSERVQRNRTRIWRVITALALVLAFVACLLTLRVYRTSQTIAEQARSTRANQLAQLTERMSEEEPLTALQLALAAQREAPGDAFSHAAMLAQRMRWNGIRSVYPPNPDQRAQDGNSSAYVPHQDGQISTQDGQTLLVFDDSLPDGDDHVQLVTHMDAPQPAVRDLPTQGVREAAISPDGALVATLTSWNAIELWNTATGARVMEVRRPKLQVPPAAERRTAPLRFSADGRYLTAIPVPGQEPVIRTWDTQTLSELPAQTGASALGASSLPNNVVPTRDPNTKLLIQSTPEGLQILRQRGGEPPLALGNGHIVGRGEAVFLCRPDESASIVDPLTDTEIRRIPNVGCPPETEYSSTGSFFSVHNADASLRNVIDTRSGATYGKADSGSVIEQSELVAAYPVLGGRDITAIFSANGRLYTTQLKLLPETQQFGNADFIHNRSASHPVFASITDQGDIVTLDSTYSRILGRIPRDQIPGPRPSIDYAGDPARLYVSIPGRLLVYRSPDLTFEREIPLPSPPEVPATLADTYPQVLELGTDDLVVLHAGTLMRLRPSSGRQLLRPTPLSQNPQENEQLARNSRLLRRPGHREDILIHNAQSLRIWQLTSAHGLDSAQQTQHINYPPSSTIGGIPLLRTSADGRSAALQVGEDGETSIINFSAGSVSTPFHPEEYAAQPLVFLPPLLVMVGMTPEIWHAQTRTRLVKTMGSPDTQNWFAESTRITSYGPGRDPIVFPLDPRTLVRDLCLLADREFTTSERELLPSGASKSRPCSDLPH